MTTSRAQLGRPAAAADAARIAPIANDRLEPDAALDAPYEILAPAQQSLPFVLASPHSGRCYPPAFLAASRLDAMTLRRSEDCFVDELFADAPALGAPLLRALFPRAFVDPNREPLELDPGMFADPLPPQAKIGSPRVAAGLGSIPRVVASGEEIYRAKLTFAEAKDRLERYYTPYHTALGQLLARTQERFGFAILIDCHSMPSVGGTVEEDAGLPRLDMVLGDCHGQACAAALTDRIEHFLKARGHRLRRNAPYAGGFCTQLYGRPARGIHALQIEINRALYMDEARYERGPGFALLRATMAALIEDLAHLPAAQLTA